MSPGFGIYFHWPFCLSKCPYCDFNSRVMGEVNQARWRAALLAELDHFAAETGHLIPTSIFFGGGTPSLMEPDTAAALIERVRQHWPMAHDLEITLEANPTSAEAGRFSAFAQGGVKRLSLGIQALDDQALRFLGRRHSVAEALAALDLASQTFGRVSFDLIYSRPGQSVAQWRDELARALDFGIAHLSAYQLTVEDGTHFASRDIALPEEDLAADMFEATQEMTEAAGLPAYEISNHARPGQECRHNLTYWRGGQWLGIGPGAHGRIHGQAVNQDADPTRWLEGVEARGHGTWGREQLDAETLLAERVMMGLRMRDGIDAATAAALDPARIARLVAGGFVIQDAAGLRTTPQGRLVLNALLESLLV
jgi:oxygen-independent coproporphyrinogen-3 oxidase